MYKTPSSIYCRVLLWRTGIPQLANLVNFSVAIQQGPFPITESYEQQIEAVIVKHSGNQQLKGCFITTWGHLPQRGPQKRMNIKICLMTPLCSTPFGRKSTKCQGGWTQCRCTDQFCHTGSRQFWQVCNPSFCTVHEYLQACIFCSHFIFQQEYY